MEAWIWFVIGWILLCLVMEAGDKRKNQRMLKRLRDEGVDLGRYIPTFKYLRGVDHVPSGFNADHTVLLSGERNFIVCSVKPDLLKGEGPKDEFWKFIEKDFCKIPKNEILRVIPWIRSAEEVEADKSPLTDLLVNQTIGRVLGVSTKTVPFVAFILIQTGATPAESIVFGVPEGEIGTKTEFDFLGLVLPDGVSKWVDYGSGALDLLGIDASASPAVNNVKRTVREIVTDIENHHARQMA